MAERKVIDCDRCGAKELKEPVEVYGIVGRSQDGAGSMENDTDNAEFCGKCSGKIISELISESYATAKQFFTKYKKVRA